MITVSFKQRPSGHHSNTPEGQNEFFGHGLSYGLRNNPNGWRPPVDIYEIASGFVVILELAGVDEDNIDITLDENTLAIKGVRPFPLTERRAVHQMEIPFGDFSCEIILPGVIATEDITANYKNGFLRIDLPKATPHNIQVNEG
jgi:HSP20 family protein